MASSSGQPRTPEALRILVDLSLRRWSKAGRDVLSHPGAGPGDACAETVRSRLSRHELDPRPRCEVSACRSAVVDDNDVPRPPAGEWLHAAVPAVPAPAQSAMTLASLLITELEAGLPNPASSVLYDPNEASDRCLSTATAVGVRPDASTLARLNQCPEDIIVSAAGAVYEVDDFISSLPTTCTVDRTKDHSKLFWK